MDAEARMANDVNANTLIFVMNCETRPYGSCSEICRSKTGDSNPFAFRRTTRDSVVDDGKLSQAFCVRWHFFLLAVALIRFMRFCSKVEEVYLCVQYKSTVVRVVL